MKTNYLHKFTKYKHKYLILIDQNGGGGANNQKYYYHGSKFDLDVLEPKPNKILDGESAVFAINSMSFAIFFIAKAGDHNVESGIIDGKPYLIEQYPGAFDKHLKGKSGYLYYVDPSIFQPDPRLGLSRYEFISRDQVPILKKKKIDDVYEALLDSDANIVTFDEKFKCIRNLIRSRVKNMSSKENITTSSSDQNTRD